MKPGLLQPKAHTQGRAEPPPRITVKFTRLLRNWAFLSHTHATQVTHRAKHTMHNQNLVHLRLQEPEPLSTMNTTRSTSSHAAKGAQRARAQWDNQNHVHLIYQSMTP